METQYYEFVDIKDVDLKNLNLSADYTVIDKLGRMWIKSWMNINNFPSEYVSVLLPVSLPVVEKTAEPTEDELETALEGMIERRTDHLSNFESRSKACSAVLVEYKKVIEIYKALSSTSLQGKGEENVNQEIINLYHKYCEWSKYDYTQDYKGIQEAAAAWFNNLASFILMSISDIEDAKIEGFLKDFEQSISTIETESSFRDVIEDYKIRFRALIKPR